MLRLTNLQKHFGGLKAVDGVDLEVAPGTVHALIGPNGSGKTTTLNVVSGIYRPTDGKVEFDGTDISLISPHQRAGLGMGRTFQNIRLFPTMTALENVMVGAQRDNNPLQAGHESLRQRALSAMEFVGILDRAHMIVRNLPYGHQRLVEIARALAGHPKLLLLDEPGAGLNQTEKQELVELLKRFRGHGLTIFLIDHDMGAGGEGLRQDHRAQLRQEDRRRLAAGRPAPSRRDRRLPRGGADRCRCSSLSASPPPTAASRRCAGFPCRWKRARWSRCSAPTAPARARRCAPSRA